MARMTKKRSAVTKSAAKKKPIAKKTAVGNAATPSTPSVDTGAVSYAQLSELYARCQGKVFEVVFANDTTMITAFLAWATAHWPSRAKKPTASSAVARAIALETLLVDDEGEGAFLPFFLSLPAPQQETAVGAMRALAAPKR